MNASTQPCVSPVSGEFTALSTTLLTTIQIAVIRPGKFQPYRCAVPLEKLETWLNILNRSDQLYQLLQIRQHDFNPTKKSNYILSAV